MNIWQHADAPVGETARKPVPEAEVVPKSGGDEDVTWLV